MPQTWLNEYFAGCIGGVAGVVVGQPFDTIKVRLQTQDKHKPLYRGICHCGTSIVRKESVYGLFKGMYSPLLGLSFINAIVFGVESQTTTKLGTETTFTHFIGGAFAGALQCIICSPMELAKTQMQVQGINTKDRSKVQYKNSVHCLLKIYKHNGLHGCNRGMILTLLRDIPGFGVYFAVYDFLVRSSIFKVNRDQSYNSGSIVKMMLAGGLAGVVSWIATYPADVIKSRIQADSFSPVDRKYSGSWDCFKKSYQLEGISVFFRGLNPTIIRAFPVNAATFAVYEVTSQYLWDKK